MLWSWLFSGLRLASGLLLLPLLLTSLSKADLGLYYVFLNLGTLAYLADFGFSLSVERGVSYALGGAASLSAMGVARGGTGGEPNEALLRTVLRATQRLYRGITVGAALLLGVGGSVVVGLGVREASSPGLAWAAWGVHLVATSLEIYSYYWIAVLRGLNRVTTSARWLVAAYGLKLAVSAVLLVAGAGLLAVPVAGLLAGIVLRAGARRAVRARVPDMGIPGTGEVRRTLAALWPNSWRLGAQGAAVFATTSSFALICMAVPRLGPEVYAEYGLSVQVMHIALGMAAVWTSVKWPIVAQWRARDDRAAIRALLAPRFRLQVATFVMLAGLAVGLGPWVLEQLGTDKHFLPPPWLLLLAVNALGELNFTFWTTLISTENRIPSAGPLVATHAVGLVAVVTLVWGAGWGVEAFVLVPLLLGGAFNYWWWARVGARTLDATFPRFVVGPLFPSHGRVEQKS